MRLLLTNDDGIDAPGIQTLARHVQRWIDRAPAGEEREAIIVAPDRNQSGMGAAVGDVFEMPPIRYRRQDIEGAPSIRAYGLDATPALCTIIGGLGTFGFVPTLVLSGINAGANVGRSVLHSGTVGAVMSAGHFQISGLAVSVQWGDEVHYETAGAVAIEVIDTILRSPKPVLFNLNVPNVPASELAGVRRGHISMAELIVAAGPFAGGEPIGDEGTLPLAMGAASPMIGDVSDEGTSDDGALVVSNYASLTAIVGPHEETDPVLDATVREALDIISQHLTLLS
jgi:5'-nucleotidase